MTPHSRIPAAFFENEKGVVTTDRSVSKISADSRDSSRVTTLWLTCVGDMWQEHARGRVAPGAFIRPFRFVNPLWQFIAENPTFPDGKGQTNDADASEKFVCPNTVVKVRFLADCTPQISSPWWPRHIVKPEQSLCFCVFCVWIQNIYQNLPWSCFNLSKPPNLRHCWPVTAEVLLLLLLLQLHLSFHK